MNTKYTFKALLCGISIWAGMSLGLTSCESYLDVDSYFYDQTNIDSIFQSKVRVNEYINGIATILPDESKLFTSLISRSAWVPTNASHRGRTIMGKMRKTLTDMPQWLCCWEMKLPKARTIITGEAL